MSNGELVFTPGSSRTNHLEMVDNLELDGTLVDGSWSPSCWVRLLTEMSLCNLREQSSRRFFLSAVPGVSGIWPSMVDRTGGIQSKVGPADALGLLVSPPDCCVVVFDCGKQQTGYTQVYSQVQLGGKTSQM